MSAGGTGRSRRHAGLLLAIVAGVVAMHLWLTREIGQRMSELAPEGPGIHRMDAVYVTTLKLSRPPTAAPAPVAKAAPKARATAKRRRAPLSPDSAASAASAPPSASAPATPPASSPTEVAFAPETASGPELAASASTSAPASASSAAASATQIDATASAASPASVMGLQAEGKPFVWPKAARVNFKMEGYYRGPIYGQASVEWVRQDLRYQVHIEASIGPSFAPLGSWRLSSEGQITPEGLAPHLYENMNRLLIKTSPIRHIEFKGDEVILPDGRHLPRTPDMQDPASQFIQLAYRFIRNPDLLKPGNTIEMPIVWLKKTDRLAYDVLGEEVLRTTVGNIGTVHVRPRRAETDPNNNINAEIWFAPELQYLPIRILMRLDDKTYMDLRMDGPPQETPGDDPEAESSAASSADAEAATASAATGASSP